MSRKANDIRRKIENKRRRKDETTLNSLAATKMISMLALRNRGFGHSRLKDFSDDFNEILKDVSDGRLSLNDILEVLKDETDLDMEDLW